MYRIAITSGEPAGIGTDILLKAAMREQHAQLVALADIQLLKDRADLLGLDIELKQWAGNTPIVQHTPGSLWVSEVPLKSACTPGKLNSANAEYVLELLNQATAGVQDGTFAAMVTAPVQKSVINDSGVAF